MGLENIIESERSIEVRVEIVGNSFGFSQIKLFFGRCPLEKYFNIRVRLGKEIHVQQVSSRKEDLNFLHGLAN
jgi:hypothetical protein